MSAATTTGDTTIRLTVSSTSTSVTKIVNLVGKPVPRPERADPVVSAVYSHIRAIRSLGHTTVNTADIARALSISTQQVETSLSALKNKGVKVAK